jgi:dTMP kinase
MRGLFIALDGVDGCGKTTFSTIVAQDLMEKFGGGKVLHVQQPGATPFGAELRRIIKDKTFPICPITERLLFAADAAEFYVYARKLMEEGTIIVSDRFTAVTDAVYGEASGTPLETIFKIQEYINPIRADLFMVMKCSAQVAAERRVRRQFNYGQTSDNCRVESKGAEFLAKVAANYALIKSADDFVQMHMEHLSINNIAHYRAKRVRVINAEDDWDNVRTHVRGCVGQLIIDEA